MKTSRKMSLASVAAIGLPVVGFAGAVAQGMPSGTQEATVAVTGGDELLLRSSTADLRSSGDVTLVANSNDELQIAADGIDPMRGWDEANLDAYAAYWEAGYNYNQHRRDL